MEEQFFWYCPACRRFEGPLVHDYEGLDKVTGTAEHIERIKSSCRLEMAQRNHREQSLAAHFDCADDPLVLDLWVVKEILKALGLLDVIEKINLCVTPREQSTGRVSVPDQES